MTEAQEVTFEPLRVTSLEDVDAIDVNTNNRAAVRSLRHGAREALMRAAKWDGYKTLSHAALNSTSLGCSGEETRDNWIELLSSRNDRIDNAVAEALGSLDGYKARVEGEVTLAKACLAKAEAILRAHPEGLDAEATQAAMAQFSGVGALDYDAEDDDEDESEYEDA
jgi:hypothetical protein